MKHLISVFVLIPIVLAAGTATAATIKKVDLTDGQEDDNRIRLLILDTSDVGPVAIAPIASEYELQLMRKLRPRDTAGSRAKLASSVDLGALLTEAIADAGIAMGLEVVSEPEDPGTWRVGGVLRDVFLENEATFAGPLIFYGYMEIELTVTRGAESRDLRLRLHNMGVRYNAGLRIVDELQEALARFLVDSAQEIVSRLNREFFKAPPHERIAAIVNALESGGAENKENELLLVGLSGAEEAVPVLLRLLDQEKEEDDRVAIINALANIGSPEAIAPLSTRYDDEDEDCRLFILKAMDYIGGDEAQQLIKMKGRKDKNDACESLAMRLLTK